MARTSDRRPLVSVIVPVWNGGRFLRESLDSILAQTYAPIEVLVMDDQSTDDTAEVAQSYGGRIRYHRQSANRGIYGNANDGIAMARGDYIAVYHADDIYAPAIVEREVGFLEAHPKAGAVFSSMIMIDPAGAERGRLTLPPAVRGDRSVAFDVVINTLLRHKNCFLMCPSSMVRTAVYRELNGYRDEEFRNTSDLDMWLRIANRYEIGVLEDRLFRYRYGHGNSAQRYHKLRTDPERYFRIMDLHLQQGASAVAEPDAIRAHEAHRSQDALLRAINAYILERRDEARRILGEVRLGSILGSGAVERSRLVLMFAALQVLVRLPRFNPVARAMSWRWNGAGRPKPGQRVRFAA
ncbi:MAG TPA: glycosyltransferase [Vicinamibacterales bacterium]|nr:glycosyltransferase [Vicinamibacterales bacterium]